ncbi:MAG: hypothetical protein IPJ65_40295 [Archangiaceae bacterium]|nr:hypothetical protein [Archangiaceae bacterium]
MNEKDPRQSTEMEQLPDSEVDPQAAEAARRVLQQRYRADPEAFRAQSRREAGVQQVDPAPPRR